MSAVQIWTDGSCSMHSESRPGGWAALLKCRGRVRELSGKATETTNQRMEITAALEALRILSTPSRVQLYSDSKYLIGTMTEGWKRRANRDLWEALDHECLTHDIEWIWIKGHAGDADNARVDALAVTMRDEAKADLLTPAPNPDGNASVTRTKRDPLVKTIGDKVEFYRLGDDWQSTRPKDFRAYRESEEVTA